MTSEDPTPRHFHLLHVPPSGETPPEDATSQHPALPVRTPTTVQLPDLDSRRPLLGLLSFARQLVCTREAKAHQIPYLLRQLHPQLTLD